MIKESAKDNGIPSYIEVDGREAWEILNEIRAVGYGGFEIVAGEEYDPQFILKASEDRLNRQQAEDLVGRWWKKEFTVNYKNNQERISVVVVNKPKKQVSHPTPPVKDKEPEVDKPEENGDNDKTDD